MEKKLDRWVRPGKGVYFAILFSFCALAFLAGHYWLGTGELLVSLLTLGYYLGTGSTAAECCGSIFSPNRTRWRAFPKGTVPFRR